MRTSMGLVILVTALGIAAWRLGARYTLLLVGPNQALRLDTRTGQVCHVSIGADGANVYIVGCTTHVTEEE